MGLLEICYENCQNNNVYQAGQQVRGRANLILSEPMKISGIRLHINGTAHTEWKAPHTSNGESDMKKYSASEGYFDTEIIIYGKPNGVPCDVIVLPAGMYSYPFVCQLPQNCPSSFESINGYIRYATRAVIVRPSHPDVKCTIPFTVVGTVDLNREPESQLPFHIDQSMQLSFLCCTSGDIECHVNLPRNGFVQGELILLNFQVFNKSNANVSSVNVKFVETCTCRAQGDTRTVEKEICQTSRPGTASGITDDWVGETLLIPSIAPTIKTCSIIDVHYQLRIEVNPIGFHEKLTVNVPILIGNVPVLSTNHNIPPVVTEQPRPFAQQGDSVSIEHSSPTACDIYSDDLPSSYTDEVLARCQMKDGAEHMLVKF